MTFEELASIYRIDVNMHNNFVNSVSSDFKESHDIEVNFQLLERPHTITGILEFKNIPFDKESGTIRYGATKADVAVNMFTVTEFGLFYSHEVQGSLHSIWHELEDVSAEQAELANLDALWDRPTT